MRLVTSSVSPKPLVVGVDVGETKIAAGVVDADGQLSGRVKVPTDTRRPEMTLQSIIDAITAALQKAGAGPSHISGVGLGIPGKVDPVNGASLLAVNPGWRAIPVKQAVRRSSRPALLY
jgi:glucokinase